MDLLEDLQVQHKTLKINHTLNTRCYSVHLKHNNYTSVFSCSLRENLPGNVHTQADLSLRKTKLNISLPYPIFEPFKCDFQTDPCQQLVQEKAEFKRRLEAYCRAHTKEKRKLRWSHIKPQKATTKLELPQYLVDLTLNGDKNPFFDGKYDWFYTGGNLEVVEIEDNPFLISTQGSKLFATHLDNFSKQKLQISRIQAPIYNIKSYYVDNLPYLSIRTKNNIKVVQFEFQNEGTFDIATSIVYEYSTEHRNSPPFIDAHLFDNNKLITADVAYAVQIHDIEASTISHQRNFESTTGDFGNLCQLESVSNCLLFMACESLSMLDFRTSSEENQRKKNIQGGVFQM